MSSKLIRRIRGRRPDDAYPPPPPEGATHVLAYVWHPDGDFSRWELQALSDYQQHFLSPDAPWFDGPIDLNEAALSWAAETTLGRPVTLTSFPTCPGDNYYVSPR